MRERVFITKYALTDGIIEVEAETYADTPTMCGYHLPGSPFTMYAHRNAWHRTREAAVIRAEQMRINKLKSLRKQVKQIEALRFTQEDK